MGCRRWMHASVLVLSSCGRIGFDPLGGSGDSSMDETMRANYAFVTSTQIAPGSLGSLDAADLMCNELAMAAGRTGTYVALISRTGLRAVDRLAGASNWIRPDGRPIVGTTADLLAGKILYPLMLDETGAERRSLAITGTNVLGDPVDTCGDYKTMTGNAGVGASDGGGKSQVTFPSPSTCATPRPFYCFQIDRVNPLPAIAAVPSKRMFVSTGTFVVGGGLAPGDSLCATSASNAGLVGSFRALLATTATTAISRFASMDPLARIDGVQVAASLDALAMGMLDSAPNVMADGTFVDVNVRVGAAGTSNCTDWTVADTDFQTLGNTSMAQQGFQAASSYGFGAASACNTPLRIYCVED